MNDAQKFDSAFADRGGVLDVFAYADLRTVFGPALQHCIDSINGFILENSALNFPVPIINVINSQSIGAAAKVVNEEYFIGINLGTFAVIETLFDRMCASKNILTEFGEADTELESVKMLNPVLINFEKFLVQWNKQEPLPYPKNENRVMLSKLLAGFALIHVVMHEYAHILHGHVDFSNSKFGISYLDHCVSVYFDENGNKKLDPLTSQTLEFDADIFATTRGIQRIQESVKTNYTFNEVVRPFYIDLNTTLYLWCFSVYSLFRLFGDTLPSVQDLPDLSHPPAPLRQMINFKCIMHKIYPTETYDEFGEEYIGLEKAIYRAAGDVERAFNEISESPKDASAFLYIIHNAEYQQQFNQYSSQWAVLRPLLEDFAFRPLPPVSQQS